MCHVPTVLVKNKDVQSISLLRELRLKKKKDFLMAHLKQFKHTSTLSSPEHLHVDPGLIQSTWAAQPQLGCEQGDALHPIP